MGGPLTLVLARVRTLDPALPEAEAVLAGGGRVLAVGGREDLRGLAPRAEVLDHRDSTLTPGLTDAHVHLAEHGLAMGRVDLTGVSGLPEALARVRARVESLPAGSWVQGGNLTLGDLGLGRLPTAAELDAVSPHHPVVISSRDLHVAWVNSRALSLAGVSEATPDPEGGRIARPLGVLLETAKGLVARVVPPPSREEYLRAVRVAAADLAALGFTAVHTMGLEPPEALAAVLELGGRGELPLRVWACVDHERLEAFRAAGLHGSAGGQAVVGGAKFFADGSLGSRTARLFPPGFADGSGTGLSLLAPETLRERGRMALELGLVPVVHAIGDRANREVLEVLADLAPLARERGIRLRSEHAQHVSPEDFARFGELGVTASVQPVHLVEDGPAIRELLPHLEATTYAFRKLASGGALLAFGSDAPVAPAEPAQTFRAATTRLDKTGTPVGPKEALSPDEVLHAYTRGPALAVGWNDYGVVREGAWAHLTLWDEVGGHARALVL